jgi:hypothetical protein
MAVISLSGNTRRITPLPARITDVSVRKVIDLVDPSSFVRTSVTRPPGW